MFFEMNLLSPLAAGAATGLGLSFGHRFLPWVVQVWDWLRGRKAGGTTGVSPSEFLLRKVTLADVTDGIPNGYQLCRFQGGTLMEKYTDSPPEQVDAGDVLWLIPAGEVWVSAGLTGDESTAQTEVGIEFDPDNGLLSLLDGDHDFNRDWLATLVGGGLMGVLASFGVSGAKVLRAGDPSTVSGCRERLDQALKMRGLRCTGLRTSDGSANTVFGGDADSKVAELANDLAQIRNRADWEQLVQSLRMAGVPVDATAAKQLESMRDEVLQKSINSRQAVTSLAQLTTEAFERAGIEAPDLRRWQTVSDRLKDESPEHEASLTEPTPPTSSPAVGMAKTARPWTWHVWSRQEVDRRQLHYTRRTVRHCRAACEQALSIVKDMPALRQVRDLNEQLALIEELLATMPPLNPRTASLKIDTHTAKSLLRSLEEAVVTTDCLAKETERLFAQVPSAPSWQEANTACIRSTAKLAQLVRDRRTVR